MNKRIIVLLFAIATGQPALGQTQDTIYYDKEWKISPEYNAEFYRIVNYDPNGAPTGLVRDYYISGELQGEGESIYIDTIDDTRSKWKNKTIIYYKSGAKEFEFSYDKLGNLNGLYTQWYENGKLKYQDEYKSGNLTDKWYTECDEFEKCQKVFFEYFNSLKAESEWNLYKDNCQSKIIKDKGLLIKTMSDSSCTRFINVPIRTEKDFSVETIIAFERGDSTSGHGLIWGFTDWNNYFYFYIAANGNYKIGAFSGGQHLEFAKWTPSIYINQSAERNLLRVNKAKDKVYYSINGETIGSEDFSSFKGDKIGLNILNGKKELFFEQLVARQDL